MLRSPLSDVCRITLLLVATILSATIPSAAATTDEIVTDACVAPRPMLPDGVERQIAGLTGDIHCYRLELAAAGLWHLSITSPPATTRAVFDLLDGTGRRTSLETFERSAAERLTFLPAGSWLIRVRAEDPLHPLPAYRLTSRFVEAARRGIAWKSEEDGELEIEGEGLVAGCGSPIFKSEEDGELEIEGEGLVAGCGSPIFKSEEDGELEIEGEGLVAGCGSPIFKSEEDGELEIEGEGLVAGCGSPIFKSEEDGELEIEGEGLVAGCADRTAEIRRALCAVEDGDDHGDTLACATPVRCRARGELSNGWGDDADVFRFRLDRWQAVEVATCGGPGARGELLDSAGQRLEDTGDSGGGLRLVRTLGPGTYFVRVSGGSGGGYGLTIRTLDR